MSRYHVFVPEVHYVRYTIEADDPPQAKLAVYTAMEEGEPDKDYEMCYNRTLEEGWHIEKVRNEPRLTLANRESDQGSDGGKEADPDGTK